jgi:hypothetical protein
VIRLFVSLIYGVSVYWVYVIFCMIVKKLKTQEKRNGLGEILVRIMEGMRKNQVMVVGGIFTWAVFMPPTLKIMGFGPHHLRIASFTII